MQTKLMKQHCMVAILAATLTQPALTQAAPADGQILAEVQKSLAGKRFGDVKATVTGGLVTLTLKLRPSPPMTTASGLRARAPFMVFHNSTAMPSTRPNPSGSPSSTAMSLSPVLSIVRPTRMSPDFAQEVSREH